MSTCVVTIPLSISNAYLLLGDRPVLVDAGGPKDGQRLIAALAEHHVTPADLALILLTHGHTDHTGALPAVAAAGTPVAVGAADVAMVERGTNGPLPPTGPAGRMLLPLVRRTVFGGWKPDLPLTGNLALQNYGVDAAASPSVGHTDGSYAIEVDTGDVIVGDMIRGGFLSGRVKPGHPLRHYFTEHPDANRLSLDQILDHGPHRLLVGHGGPLQADDVRRRLSRIV